MSENKKDQDPRTRKLSRKENKIAKQTYKTVPGTLQLLRKSLMHLWQFKRSFLGIFAIYFVLYFVFVNGLATNFQLQDTESLIEEALGSQITGVEKATTLFGTLVGTAGSTPSESASVYQTILFVIFSLVIIWALRQTMDGKIVGIKESFYRSMHPLIPYIIVLFVLVLQLIPMLLGVGLYGSIVSGNIAQGLIEQLFWLALMLALVSVSAYFAIGTLIASYIATLPGMEPLKSMRIAKGLVKFRRALIIRRVLVLAIIIALFSIMIFLPLVLYLPVIAEITFLIFSLAFMFMMHSFFYSLYKELI